MCRVSLVLVVVIFFSCSIKKTIRTLPEHSLIPLLQKDTIATNEILTDTLKTIGIEQWISEKFLILEKSPLFKRHGYEIYRFIDSTSGTELADTNIELSNFRIRYDKFVGDTLEVIEIKNDNEEWNVKFRDKRFSLVLYARTHNGAIKDLLLLRDLEAAKERWIGRVIYSRKGIISVEGEGGMFSSKKVSRLDSLTVYNVKCGMTPLPVNPIWLEVQASNNIKGFIPVRVSWSNTMKDKIFDGIAWEDEVSEKNPALEYNWEPHIWQIIDNHRIVMDMSKEQVYLSWGRPVQEMKKNYDGNMVDCWIYNNQELYFNQKGLFAIQEITIK